MAIHTLDAARYVSGADPVSVYCEEFNPEWSWYKGASSATALFEMTGGCATLIAAPGAAGRDTSWEADCGRSGRAARAVGRPRPAVRRHLTGTEGFTRQSELIEGEVRHDTPPASPGLGGLLERAPHG
ncbi:MAG: oxidoreductase [Lasallia pustulata]|uniref:Oxidoreductase n=1 Tax=Lasallia pustulata TaxID=136370 RepID=A0A5M8PEJ6_9LECA|nr:MAG: oxidoreductase [Lasallia pustulata]